MTGAARAGSPQPRLVVPAVAAATAAVVVAGNAAGRPALAAAVIALQVVLGGAWLLFFAVPAQDAVAVGLVGVAAAAADVVVLRTRAAPGGSLVGVIGLSVIVVLFHQLARRDPHGVTGAVSVTLSAIVLVTALALLLPLRELPAGRAAVFAAVAAAATALVVARLLGGPDPLRRLAGLVVAALVSLACGLPSGGLATGDAVGIGLAAAVTVLLADRMMQRITLSQATGRAPTPYARMIAPVSALLPLALASPIAYLAGRIIASGGK